MTKARQSEKIPTCCLLLLLLSFTACSPQDSLSMEQQSVAEAPEDNMQQLRIEQNQQQIKLVIGRGNPSSEANDEEYIRILAGTKASFLTRDDITVDIDPRFNPTVCGDAWDVQTLEKVKAELEKKGLESFQEIIIERVDMPVWWGDYIQDLFSEENQALPKNTKVFLTDSGKAEEQHNLDNYQSRLEYLLDKPAPESNPVLQKYYELLAPGGKITFMSSASDICSIGMMIKIRSCDKEHYLQHPRRGLKLHKHITIRDVVSHREKTSKKMYCLLASLRTTVNPYETVIGISWKKQGL